MIRAFFIYLGVAVVGIIFFALMVLLAIPAIQNSSIALAGLSSGSSKNDNTAIDKQSIDAEINKLQKKLDSYTPSDAFIIVNTCENHFYLYKDKKLILNGLCSTGKNERLIRMTKKGRKEICLLHT
jgi:outer membrane murein-binding lipoprotein Lpp